MREIRFVPAFLEHFEISDLKLLGKHPPSSDPEVEIAANGFPHFTDLNNKA
jgi:hypothetical protein